MGLIFKDTVGNTNTSQTVLYLQSKTIKANTSVQWNNKIQGYFYNNNSTTTQLIVKSGIGDLNIVMQPYEKFSFPYVDINSVSNVSKENDITMYFSNSEFGFFSTSNNVFITNSSLDMNLTNTSVDVNLLNSTVEISNSSLDMNLLNASVDVNLLNSSVDVNLLNSTVEISNSSIDANITNSSLDMNLLNSSVDVNLLNSTVEISNSSLDMNLLNASVDVNLLNSSVDVNLLNSTVEISNSSIDANITNSSLDMNLLNSSVDVNLLNSTVEISNSSLDMNLLNASVDVNLLNSSVDVNLLNSTVEISNSSIDTNILNSSIDINIIASTVTLDTDLGNISLNSEPQASLIYNPYGLSTSTNPTINGAGDPQSAMSGQQNNARGYINFNIYVYNPTSSSGSATLSVNLYNKIPPSNTATSINSFSFNSGTIDATSGVWINIQPNIFWDYNSIYVYANQQTGTGGSSIAIGVVNTSEPTGMAWTGSYWNQNNNIIAIYWQTTNTAPASLPVTVQGGEVAITGTAKIYDFYEYTSGDFNSTIFSASDFIPNGYLAHILGIFFGWAAGTTNSATKIGLILQVNPVNSFIVGYTTMDIASGSYYACAIGESIASNTPIAGVSNSLNGMLNINNLILNSSSTFSLLNSVESPSIASSTPIMTVRYILEPIITRV